MADFDAILRKALSSRPDAPGDERRKIYERARQALVRQLTGFEPPLPPEDISRQRLALETAIRKVEADMAANGGVLPSAAVAAASAMPQSAAPRATPQPVAPAAPVSRATPTIAKPAPIPPATPAPRAPQAAVPQPVAPVAPVAAPAQPEMPDFVAEQPQQPQGELPDFESARSQPAVKPAKKRGGSATGMIVGILGLLVLLGGGFIAWQLGLLDGGNTNETAEVAGEAGEAPDVRTVGSDPTRSGERLLPDNQGSVEETPTETAPEPTPSALPVAQSAILYEEGLTPEADGFTAPGRAVWRLDETGASPSVVGTIEVPERGISMTMRVSENQDASLPATHLIEMAFELSEAFPATSIAELVGVVVKPQEQAGGDPLRGAIVDLGDGVFWQALAAGEADQAINVPLLRDGQWFDLPVLYDDNRRAIISFEKGDGGVAVFQQALNAWSSN